MGIRAIENAILREAREVFANKSLRLCDVLEWRTAPFAAKVPTIEVVEHLPRERVWVCILAEHDHRVEKGGAA